MTPVGGDARGTSPARWTSVWCRPGVGGGETAVPDFKISPETPTQLETVTFNAADPELDAS